MSLFLPKRRRSAPPTPGAWATIVGRNSLQATEAGPVASATLAIPSKEASNLGDRVLTYMAVVVGFILFFIVGVCIFNSLTQYGCFHTTSKRTTNKLRKRRPATTEPEPPKHGTNDVEIKADDSLDILPARPHQQSHRLNMMFSTDDELLSSSTTPQHPTYRGVVQREPLHAPMSNVFHPTPQRGLDEFQEVFQSPIHAMFQTEVRNLMDPNQAPSSEVQPLEHLRGRPLRRMPGLMDIRRVYNEQNQQSNTNRSQTLVPDREPPAVENRSTAHVDKAQDGGDLDKSTEPLELDDGTWKSVTSHVSYESEPVVEHARVALRTSAHAAVVVPANQETAEQVQARGTTRVFPLVSGSLDAEISAERFSNGRKVFRFSLAEDFEEDDEPAASSSETTPNGMSHPPVYRTGNTTACAALSSAQSGQPPDSTATTSPLPEPSALEDTLESSSPPRTSSTTRRMPGFYHELYSQRGRLRVTNPGPSSEAS